MKIKTSVLRILITCFLFSCVPAGPTRYTETRLSISGQSTIPVSVILYAERKPDWDSLFQFLESKSMLYDHRIAGSPIQKLNTEYTTYVPAEIYQVIKTAIEIAVKSKGAFDPTVLPLTRLWNFDYLPQDTITQQSHPAIPSARDISHALKFVDYTQVQLSEDNKITLPAGYGIDLGGIAKGALVDALSDYLDTQGYSNYLIEAGGDIIVSGLKPDNRKWVIGITHPRDKTERLEDITLGASGNRIAVVTSGDYEKYFEQDGKRYHHIIDPHTGYPARNAISVTVIAPTCTRADALATAVFVLGKDEGIRLLKDEENTEGLLVYEDDEGLKTIATEGFSLFLK